LASSVYRDAQDPNTVVVVNRFPDQETARHFLGSPELQRAMERAGVVGQPELWFTEDLSPFSL